VQQKYNRSSARNKFDLNIRREKIKRQTNGNKRSGLRKLKNATPGGLYMPVITKRTATGNGYER